MKPFRYTFILERTVNGLTIRRQAKATDTAAVRRIIRAHLMANVGWKLSDLPCNNPVKQVLNEA